MCSATQRLVEPTALTLCSRTAGRDRWYVAALEDRPRLAATVETVLRSEEGIQEVRANPLTGRVLVCYDAGVLAEPVETLICRALDFGPMSHEEYSLFCSRRPVSRPFESLIQAELGCCVFQMIAFGGICPVGLAAAALILLFRWQRDHLCRPAAMPATVHSGSVATS
jgi:hypothetical protein